MIKRYERNRKGPKLITIYLYKKWSGSKLTLEEPRVAAVKKEELLLLFGMAV